MGGHRFLDVARFANEIELARNPGLETALLDIYRSVDEALGRILAVLPRHTDVLVVSPTGMGPNTPVSPAPQDAACRDGGFRGRRGVEAPAARELALGAFAPRCRRGSGL